MKLGIPHITLALALLIVVIATGLRISEVGEIPQGLFCDEASTGYNAYSILTTGKDEFGRSFPLYFTSFGDFKPASYVYPTVVSVWLFGLNEFAVRLPATLYLGGAALALYFLLSVWIHPLCGLLGLIFVVQEPWLHHFSHIGFELSAGPLFIILGLVFWHVAATRSRWVLYLSISAFVAGFYAYPPCRVLVVGLVPVLLILYRKELLSKQNRLLTGSALGLALISGIPFVSYLLYEPRFLERVEYLGIFSTGYYNLSAGYKWWSGVSWLSFENIPSAVQRGLIALWNYVQYFNPTYLFFRGDSNLRFAVPDYGVLSVVTGGCCLLGILVGIIRRDRPAKVLLAWILIAPLAAALTWEDIPHSGRFVAGLPAFSALAAYGSFHVLVFIGRYTSIAMYLGGVAVVTASVWVAVPMTRYYHNNYSKLSSGWMQYGYRDAMKYIEEYHEGYERVEIRSTFLHYMPHIFALFYSKKPPLEWQEKNELPWNISVEERPLQLDQIDKQTLYLFSPPVKEKPLLRKLEKISEIPYEDGLSSAFAFYRAKRSK